MVDRGILVKQFDLPCSVDHRIQSLQLPIRRGPKHLLPPGFKPGKWDVICHQGRWCQTNVGNRRFKICIENHLSSYMKTASRRAKSALISNIVDCIRDSSAQDGGGFVRWDRSLKRWYQVGDRVARDKVGNSLRLLIEQKNSNDGTDDKKISPSSSLSGDRKSMATSGIDDSTSLMKPIPMSTTSLNTASLLIEWFEADVGYFSIHA